MSINHLPALHISSLSFNFLAYLSYNDDEFEEHISTVVKHNKSSAGTVYRRRINLPHVKLLKLPSLTPAAVSDDANCMLSLRMTGRPTSYFACFVIDEQRGRKMMCYTYVAG